MNQHLSIEQLGAFVAGKLDSEETDSLLAHLAECDQCLAEMDRLWGETSPGQGLASTPDPSPEASARMQRSLFSSIHRFNLMGEILRLSTQGLLAMVTGLLQPVTRRNAEAARQGEAHDD